MTNVTGDDAASTDIAFGGWLKQHRQEQGTGPKQFAELIGCSAIALLKIEAGKRRPSRQLAEIVAEQINIAPDEREAFIAFARRGHSAALDPESEIALRAPWRTAHSYLTNLPSALTSFIGREADVDRAQSLILQPKVRLLTLSGAPGIGKTRLALQVATNLVSNFEDGVFLVELAPVSDPDLLLDTVARTLGLKSDAAQSIKDVLFKHLSERRMLLLLDNFEHLLDAAPAVVRLLEASPWLKVLTTSREPLRVRGERRLPVPPLSTFSGQHIPAANELADYSAVALFVERAETVSPDFRLTDANAADIAAICVGLEGLPLAIELAAARANHFSTAYMKEAFRSGKMENRLGFLTGGGHDLPPRQRTLRNATEWSYGLLEEEEKALFRRLSVFVGGFTPEAVGAVCMQGGAQESHAASAPAQLTLSTLDRLLSLSEKSLVSRDSREGVVRFGLFEFIREYASEKLHEDPREAEAVERLHALYFMQLAEKADSLLRSAQQKEGVDKLEWERDNLRASLRWTSRQSEVEINSNVSPPAPGAAEIALRTASALSLFSFVRGYYAEGREQLEAALSMPIPLRPPQELQQIRAKAFRGAGALSKDQGDFSPARVFFEESLRLCREVGNNEEMARTLHSLGVLAYEQADFLAARSFYEETIALKRELGLQLEMAAGLTDLGLVLFMQNDYVAARRLHEESLAISREIGNATDIGRSLNNLALAIYAQEDYLTASALFNESLIVQRELGYKWGVATAFANLGLISLVQGDYAAARSLNEECLAIYREIGNKRSIADALSNLSMVDLMQGDYSAARKLCDETLALYKQVGDKYGTAVTLTVLAGVEAGSGRGERAATLLGAATRLLDNMGVGQLPEYRATYGRADELARASLDNEAFAEAQQAGRTLTLEEAITYASHPQEARV